MPASVLFLLKYHGYLRQMYPLVLHHRQNRRLFVSVNNNLTVTGIGSGESAQRGISRSKSGSSQRRVGRSKCNENLRGGTRTGVDKEVSGVGNGNMSKNQRDGNSNPAYSGFSSDVSMQSDLTSSYPTATDIMSNIPSE
jgi:hypothetical protein